MKHAAHAVAIDAVVMERRQATVIFLTPAELCDRWRIHTDTLAKIDLPWFRPRPRCRLIDLAFVERYERANGWTS